MYEGCLLCPLYPLLHVDSSWAIRLFILLMAPCTLYFTCDGGSWARSLKKQRTFRDTTSGFLRKITSKDWMRAEIPYCWCVTSPIWDLGNTCDWPCRMWKLLQPNRNTSQIWVVTRQRCGISAHVPQTSFRGETSGGVAKCGLFSQATKEQCLTV